MTKPIFIDLHGAGSGRGLSYWMDWLRCPNRRRLRDESMARGDGIISDQTEQQLFGVAYHALQELYVRAGRAGFDLDNVKIKPFDGEIAAKDMRAFEGAKALFREFRGRYPYNYFGRPLETEAFYELDPVESESLGFPPIKITCRVDLVSQCTLKQAAQINKDHGLSILPGRYIDDYKTTGSAWWLPASAESPQMPLYQMIYRKKHPNAKLAGARICGAVKPPAAPDFPLLFVPPLDEDSKNFVRGTLWTAYQASIGWPYECNPNYCYDGGRLCRFAREGSCRRY